MDLAADEEQLNRYGLPIWKTEENVAAALSLTIGQLRHLSQHRQRETAPHYITFAIPKRSGGERLIHAPKRRLKEVLRKLDRLLVRSCQSEHAHGFVRGRSIASNAAAHVGKAVVLRFDIKDCFPTIHYGRVRGLLIALGYSYPVAASLAVLDDRGAAPAGCGRRQALSRTDRAARLRAGRADEPRALQRGAGAARSPSCRPRAQTQLCLHALRRRPDVLRQRYGQDRQAPEACSNNRRGRGILRQRRKTRIMRAGQRQSVTGVIVNKGNGPLAPGAAQAARRAAPAEDEAR